MIKAAEVTFLFILRLLLDLCPSVTGGLIERPRANHSLDILTNRPRSIVAQLAHAKFEDTKPDETVDR
jgi:hypothetical protein